MAWRARTPVSSVGQLRALSGRRLLFRRDSYTEPPAWYAYDPATGQTRPGLDSPQVEAYLPIDIL